MRRVAVSLAQVAALVVGLAGCGGGSRDFNELVIAQIVFASNGSSTPPLPTDVFRFSLAGNADVAGTRVFDGVGVTPADQGRTFTVGPAGDAQFAALATMLTNGVNDQLVLFAANDGGGGGLISGESQFVVGLDPGFTGPDLVGFTLTRIELVVDQFSTTPAGGGTDYQFTVRFVFLGVRN